MRPLILLLFILFFSCEPFEYGEEQTYTVEEGDHHSDFPLKIEGRVIDCQVRFTESCRYDPLPKPGWNKLIGLAVAFDINNDDNSARWAWRYDHDTDLIKLAMYTYVNGERQIKEVYSVEIGRWVELYIAYNKQLTKWEYYTGDSEMLGGWVRCPEFKQKHFRWSGLYFGGESVAPHDIHVQYKFEK